MTPKMNAIRQFNFTLSRSERPVAGRSAIVVSQPRRISHAPRAFLAVAILVPASGDVNLNLEMSADDFGGVTSDVNVTAATFLGEGAILTEPTDLSVARIVAAVDDEDEDEDEDDYDDDDLDEDDDEDLDDEDDEEYDDEDDLEDEDDDLDNDDLDDEDEDDEDEDDE